MVEPKGCWLLVSLDRIVEVTRGGIFMPGETENRQRTGRVKAVGPGRKTKAGTRIPIDVAVGQRISFFRENLEHKQGKDIIAAMQELDDEGGTALIHEDSILFKYED